MSKRIKKLISVLAGSALAFFMAACVTLCIPAFPKSTAATSVEYKYTDVTATELAWDAASGRRKASSGYGHIRSGGSGQWDQPIINTGNVPVGFGVAIPDDVEGEVSVGFGFNLQLCYVGESNNRFRLVLNDKIIFPASGGWWEFKSELSSNWSQINPVLDNVTMKAGDELYFMFDDPDNRNWGSEVKTTVQLAFDGVTFYAVHSGVNYLNPADENDVTYFGKTYKESDILKYYEFVCNDIGQKVDLGIDGYESYTIAENVAIESFPWENTGNLVGSEYFVFDVTNGNTGANWVNLEVYEWYSEPAQAWSAASGMPYYLEYKNGTMTKAVSGETGSEYAYKGAYSVPANFVGKVYIPVSAFEMVGWQTKQENVNLYGEAEVMNLALGRLHVKGVANGMTIHSLGVVAADLDKVENTANTAINLIEKIGVVTTASETAIANARKVYDGLSDSEQEKVTNYAALVEAEEVFYNLSVDVTVIGTDGKDFTGTEGVVLDSVYSSAPSTISAWIKVDRSIADDVHIGTVIGNKELYHYGNTVFFKPSTFSVEITANGHPRFVWNVDTDVKTRWEVDNVDVRTGRWLNLAFTRDAANGVVACYVNGVRVSSFGTDASSLADFGFYKPVVIGADYTFDKVFASGYAPDFGGMIADVRVYSSVLTENEIAANMASVVANKGIMTAVNFLSGEVGGYYDAATLTEAVDAYSYQDFDLSDLKLGDYSIAVLGDTQRQIAEGRDNEGDDIYSDNYDKTTNTMYKNIQWLIENKEALGLQFVMHMGDITENLHNDATKGMAQMDLALGYMDALTVANIPWSLNRGNHDNHEYFSKAYSKEKYGALAAGTMEENMLNTYYTFQAGTQKYLVVQLNVEPSDAALTWANGVIEAHADYRVIITTHAYVDNMGNYLTGSLQIGENYGKMIWDECASLHKNVVLVLSGHSCGMDIVKNQVVGANGNTVWQVMIDQSRYDSFGMQQAGNFAVLGFEDEGNTIHFNFISAALGQQFRNCNNFTIKLDGSHGFNDANSYNLVNGYATKEDLPIVLHPEMRAYVKDSETDLGSLSGTLNAARVTTSPWTINVIGMNIQKDGIFYFDKESFVNSYWDESIGYAVFVTDTNKVTKKVYPLDSQFTTPGVHNNGCQGELQKVGGIAVNAGDMVSIAWKHNNDGWAQYDRGVKIWGNVYNKAQSAPDATVVQELRLYSCYADATADDLMAVYNGTKTDYVFGWTQTGRGGASVIKDEAGNVILSTGGANYYAQLPNVEMGGKTLLGWTVDGAFYPIGASVHTDKTDYWLAVEATAVFAEISMVNGAAIRISDNSGIKFNTYVKMPDLSAYGITVSYGTILAPAYEISNADGVKDYTLLTKEFAGKKIDLPSTVQFSIGGYTVISSSLIGFSEDQYDLEVVARGYMTVTYADGTAVTYYANVTDNARSVKEVAEKVLSDVSKVKTVEYSYAVEGGYSKYDEATRQKIAAYIGA